MSASHPDEIRAAARVIELLRDGACRVELTNGHRAIVRAPRHGRLPELNDAVTAAFHPYDLSRGWIVSGSEPGPPDSPGA
jgi:translation initiation factor IF-1